MGGGQMKTIMISVHPEWVAKILSGEKTLEIRKTMPKCELPFKVLMYCTKHRHFALVQGGGKTSLFYACNPYTAFIVGGELANGKVVGEFICDKVNYINYETIEDYSGDVGDVCYNNSEYEKMCSDACIDYYSLFEYSSGKDLYALHITAVKAYDKPKELGEYGLTRPPQSWQYIQEKEECKEE
jgi:predicted transcriptional regulator